MIEVKTSKIIVMQGLGQNAEVSQFHHRVADTLQRQGFETEVYDPGWYGRRDVRDMLDELGEKIDNTTAILATSMAGALGSLSVIENPLGELLQFLLD